MTVFGQIRGWDIPAYEACACACDEAGEFLVVGSYRHRDLDDGGSSEHQESGSSSGLRKNTVSADASEPRLEIESGAFRDSLSCVIDVPSSGDTGVENALHIDCEQLWDTAREATTESSPKSVKPVRSRWRFPRDDTRLGELCVYQILAREQGDNTLEDHAQLPRCLSRLALPGGCYDVWYDKDMKTFLAVCTNGDIFGLQVQRSVTLLGDEGHCESDRTTTVQCRLMRLPGLLRRLSSDPHLAGEEKSEDLVPLLTHIKTGKQCAGITDQAGRLHLWTEKSKLLNFDGTAADLCKQVEQGPDGYSCIQAHASDAAAWTCAFSPDESLVASGGDDGVLCVFARREEENSEQPWLCKWQSTTRDHSAGVTSALFLDTDTLVSGSYDEKVRIWKRADGNGSSLEQVNIQISLVFESTRTGDGIYRLLPLLAPHQDNGTKEVAEYAGESGIGHAQYSFWDKNCSETDHANSAAFLVANIREGYSVYTANGVRLCDPLVPWESEVNKPGAEADEQEVEEDPDAGPLAYGMAFSPANATLFLTCFRNRMYRTTLS
ncbi:unnamed protein product [Amoebophrya sp. A25]|nr:unnamed protein product [Amoebophrya sp. A25]|eukprot:GSA25T00011365001.1